MYGVELVDGSMGNNDGTVEGERSLKILRKFSDFVFVLKFYTEDTGVFSR